MSSLTDTLTWLHFKASLQAHSEWLVAFSKSAVVQAIDVVNTRPRNYYEPLLLDTELKEASKALERCLAFRREAYELEIAAVKAAADYELFKQLADIDAQLETNALPIRALQAEADGFGQASPKYSDEGFKKHDAALSERAAADLKAATERQDLLKERWDVRYRYEADYHSRHVAPGNAHNFKERLERTILLLADDLQEAYEKLLATHIGLRAIYNKNLPFPELHDEGSLDELVLWTRDVIRFLDLESQDEVSYDLVIPLGQEWKPSAQPIISPKDLWASVDEQGAKKTIRFELNDVFFNQEHVRVRAVGLAFGSKPASIDPGGGLDSFAYWRLRATIHTPKQPNVNSPGSYYVRPPVVFGDVSAYGRNIPVAMRTGPECQNLDPRGEWTVVLNKYSVWSNTTSKTIEGSPDDRPVTDLKLFLSLVSKPIPDAASVFAP